MKQRFELLAIYIGIFLLGQYLVYRTGCWACLAYNIGYLVCTFTRWGAEKYRAYKYDKEYEEYLLNIKK